VEGITSIKSAPGFFHASLIALSILSLACVNANASQALPSSAPIPMEDRAVLEGRMDGALCSVPSSVDFSFCVEDSNGGQYSFDRGSSTMTTMYDSASTSKLVAAVVILRQVENGYLGLGDHPQDFIDPVNDWTIPPTDPLYGITLSQLLSFTSGLETDPPGKFTDMTDEINAIAQANAGNGISPGSEFYYASTHLQVAGLMAVNARGVENWNALFDEFRNQTGLFPTSSFCLPPVQPDNPRLAGGMRWTGEEYLGFLRALAKGELLGPGMMDQLLADHTPSNVVAMAYSPVLAAPPNGLGEEWHYGFGLWQECKGAPYSGIPGSRVSSPGAYGAYPFWDRAHGYFGIVARQGALGTYPEGIQIERSVEEDLNLWAAIQP